MNFSAKALSYLQTGYFSRIITEYLSGNEFLKKYYQHPVSYTGIEASIEARKQFPTDRHVLVSVLDQQYKVLPVFKKVQENLSKLSQPDTFTITTAHQPAIFTGTLYFIYKILHVIKIAADLCERYPDKHFVPVFYMGSEDADLDELGHIYLDNEKLSWNTKQSGAVGRMQTEGLEKILQRIEGEYAGYPYGTELVELLKECYLNSENIQQATLKLLNQLFGSYGLVILIPDNRLLKSVMRGIFRDDLTNHIPYKIISEHLLALSGNFPVQANPREINLFYLFEDIRERIDWKDGQYIVNNTNIRFSPEALEKELANSPERFSPNVILRGLFQETVLPNIAFVGGGGEMAYWLELKKLFLHYRVPFPMLILRNSFLLIRHNWKAKMSRAGLSPERIFKKEEVLMEEFVRGQSRHQLNLDKPLSSLKTLYDSLKEISGAVDKTLEPHVAKLEAQAAKRIKELEKKILRAEKRNYGDIRQKIHDIRGALFPMDNLQERVDNFIPWYASYGSDFLEHLLFHSGIFDQQFIVLEENTAEKSGK